MTRHTHYDTLRVEVAMECAWCGNEIEDGEEIAGTKYSPKFFCRDKCIIDYEADMFAAECDAAYDRARDEKLMRELE